MHAPRVFLRRAVSIASICSHFNIAALQTAAGSMQRSSGSMQRSSGRVRMRRVGAVAGRQRPDRRGRLLRGRRGGLDRCSRSRRSSLRHSAVGCRMCVRAVRMGAHIGRERAAARARGFPAGGAGRRTVAWLPPVSIAPSGAAGAAAVAGSTAPVRWGCDNCGGNGPLAAGRYQRRLELQLMMRPQWGLHAWPPSPR